METRSITVPEGSALVNHEDAWSILKPTTGTDKTTMEQGKPRILCLDDRIDSSRVRKFLLEQFGCEVVTVTDSSSCLHTVAQETFDLVVLDYHLAEEITGEDVARDINAFLPEMPLIMLTGDPTLPDSVKECVDAVLVKGCGPRELLDTIQKLLPGRPIKPRREAPVTPSSEKTS